MDPSLHSSCLVMATDALSGKPHRGIGGLVFGDRTGWLSWHWQEMALGALAAVGGGLVLLGVRRRRRLARTS